MRHLFRVVLACALLGAALSSCSGNDDSSLESALIQGVFRSEDGAPMAGMQVSVVLYDSLDENLVDYRWLTTDGAGGFRTTFSFDAPTFPVHVQVQAWPALGTGMTEAWDFDSTMRPAPGSSSAALHYELTSYVNEPSVIGIPAAPLTRAAIVGRYAGESVRPYDAFSGQVYIDSIVFRPGTSSDLGTFDFGYSATKVGGIGDVFGDVHDDTLFMQLSEVEPGARNTSYKVTATSVTADTLIAWPEPCSESCISKDSPIRLVRWP